MRTIGYFIAFFNEEDFNAHYDAKSHRLEGATLIGPPPKSFPCCFEYDSPFSAQFCGDYKEVPVDKVIRYVEEQTIYWNNYWNNLKNLLTNN